MRPRQWPVFPGSPSPLDGTWRHRLPIPEAIAPCSHQRETPSARRHLPPPHDPTPARHPTGSHRQRQLHFFLLDSRQLHAFCDQPKTAPHSSPWSSHGVVVLFHTHRLSRPPAAAGGLPQRSRHFHVFNVITTLVFGGLGPAGHMPPCTCRKARGVHTTPKSAGMTVSPGLCCIAQHRAIRASRLSPDLSFRAEACLRHSSLSSSVAFFASVSFRSATDVPRVTVFSDRSDSCGPQA